MTVAQLIGRERAHLALAIALRGAGIALALAALVVGAGTILLGDARWITRPGGPLAAWALTIAILLVAAWWTRHLLHRTAAPAAVAREIERERRLRAGSLRGALEVAESGALGRRAAEQLASSLAAGGRVLAPAVHARALRRGLVAGAAAVLALVLLGAATRRAPDGWRAIRHPIGAWTGALLEPLRIVDAPRVVLRGDRLRIRVLAPARRELSLSLRRTGAAWETHELGVEQGVAETTIGPLDADVKLVAADGRTTSDTVVVRVTDRPFVGDVAMRATYPAYLERPPETIPVGEPARLPRGTVLSIQGRASTELATVGLAAPGDTVRLEPDGHSFSGRLQAEHSGRWSWFASSGQGNIADVPAALELEVIPDSAPRVEILAPAKDTTVLPDAQLALRASAIDDHGIATVTMRSWRQLASGKAMPEIAQAIASPAAPQWAGEQTIDLSPRGLEPGDELHVVVAATDDSPWRQTAVSREVILRVPSLSEQRQAARALGDSAAARAEAAAKAERDLAQRTSEAARSRDRTSGGGEQSARGGSQRSMSFQSAEEAKGLAKQQQQLQEQVKQLAAAGALDSALSQRLREAQDLLRQALTPELAKQLDDVMKATQQLSPEDARRAMENLAQQQQRLREALERSAEMLKRAAMEGSMQTLRDEAKELAQRERSLADSMARQPRSAGDSAAASRAAQAQALSKRSSDLAKDVQSLAKRLQQEKAESAPPKLQAGAQHAQQSSEAMQRAAQNGNDRAGEGGSSAREGAQQMDQAAQQLAQAREQQIQEWKQELTGELDRSIQETLQLAREQQSLSERARSGQSEGLRGDQSAVQQGVEKVGERIQKAAQKSSHISPQSQGALGEARKRVQDATQATAESQQRGGQELAQTMDAAAQALNKAAAQMMRDRERAASASSASGFAEMLEQMREMAKQQGSLNAQSAGLLPTPGMQPGAAAMQQARQLAKQQRGLADRMDDAGNGEARAAALAKEMRQIADQLEQGRIDPGLLQRQQQLFHRLLDAGLTLQKDEREDNGKREAEAAINAPVLTPGNTQSTGRAAERWREPTWNELRGLTAEERRAVIEYFKRINAEQP